MKFVVLLIVFFYSTSIASNKNSFTISGKITNAPDNFILLLKEYNIQQNSHLVLDTLKINPDGSFNSKMQYEAGIYQLDPVEYNEVNIAVETGQNIFIAININQENGTSEVETKGSRDTQLVLQYDRLQELSYKKWLAPVRKEMRLARDAGNDNRVKELSEKESDRLLNYQDDLALFAENNFGNSIALFYAAIRLNPDRHLEFMTRISDLFSKGRPGLQITQRFNSRLERFKKLALGKLAPDVKLKTAEGKEFQLSALKGKFVLLDFWAAWCTPCRVENPNYARMYEKYKGQGFEIFGISIDTNSKLWQQAAKRDKITWIDTSDLKGWDGEFTKLYNISAIPANFLLDKSGNIIAKNIRGLVLEKKLEELFE